MALHIQKFMITPLIFFFKRCFPQNMKANISIWSTRIGWVENYIHRSEYNDLKMAILFKKKPASLILVIQFTYKGWINNSKKLWSYFNETKAEKKVHALKLNFKHFYHFKIDINPIEHAIIAFKSLKRLNWRVISRIRCGVGTARLAWPCCDVSHDSADSSWARLALPCHGRGRNTAE